MQLNEVMMDIGKLVVTQGECIGKKKRFKLSAYLVTIIVKW